MLVRQDCDHPVVREALAGVACLSTDQTETNSRVWSVQRHFYAQRTDMFPMLIMPKELTEVQTYIKMKHQVWAR
jgi:hypothetical protein